MFHLFTCHPCLSESLLFSLIDLIGFLQLFFFSGTIAMVRIKMYIHWFSLFALLLMESRSWHQLASFSLGPEELVCFRKSQVHSLPFYDWIWQEDFVWCCMLVYILANPSFIVRNLLGYYTWNIKKTINLPWLCHLENFLSYSSIGHREGT